MSTNDFVRQCRGVITERADRIGESANLPVVSVTNNNGIQPARDTFSRQVHSTDQAPYKIVRRGWYAFNPSRINVGSIARNELAYDACLSPMYTVFELTSDDVDPQYFQKFVASKKFTALVCANLQGSVRDVLSFDALESFRFRCPPLSEQRAISEVLDATSMQIKNTEALIGALCIAKTAIMRELLTRGVRRQNALMKPLPERWVLGRVAENIGVIPANWDLVRLTTVAKLESGHTPDRKEPNFWDGNIPWISLQDAEALGSLTVRDTAETIGPEGLANSSARMLPAGTVVLQRTANVGLCATMEREMCTSQHFANWICGSALHPQYLQQVFRHMVREWRRLIAGSVLPDIYMNTFKKLQILLPPIDEQIAIAEIGEGFDLRIERERALVVNLEKNLAALSQEMLSGRVRLPEAMIARHRDKRGKAA